MNTLLPSQILSCKHLLGARNKRRQEEYSETACQRKAQIQCKVGSAALRRPSPAACRGGGRHSGGGARRAVGRSAPQVRYGSLADQPTCQEPFAFFLGELTNCSFCWLFSFQLRLFIIDSSLTHHLTCRTILPTYPKALCPPLMGWLRILLRRCQSSSSFRHARGASKAWWRFMAKQAFFLKGGFKTCYGGCRFHGSFQSSGIDVEFVMAPKPETCGNRPSPTPLCQDEADCVWDAGFKG